MKQKIRLGDNYALLYRLSAYWRDQLSEIFRKHKRKPSSRRRFHTKPKNGRPSLASLKEKSCVQTPAKVPALPGLGLAMGIMAFALSALNIQLQAQDTIKPLQIGDTIPEYVWHLPLQVVNHPEGKETITLNDYRGKLIILDFWATWCGSCIKAFPLVDSLVLLHPEMQVVKVTKENLASSQIEWTSVINGHPLAEVFPYRIIPHYVWINSAGELHAFSKTEQLTSSNIIDALNNESPNFTVVKDLNVKIDKPLFLTEDFQSEGLQHYAVLYKGKYDGLGSVSLFRKSGDKLTGRTLANRPLYDLYTTVARGLLEKEGQAFGLNRIVTEVNDSTGLAIQRSSVTPDNLYSYDISVAPENAGQLFEIMLDDLNRHTQYHGTIECRVLDCFVLKLTGDEDKLASKGGPASSTLRVNTPISLNNYPLRYLAIFLNSYSQLPHIVLNETGYEDPVDIQLQQFTTVDDFNKQLKKYGLALEKASRSIPMFIIRDKLPNR